jgi:hypothetical protein
VQMVSGDARTLASTVQPPVADDEGPSRWRLYETFRVARCCRRPSHCSMSLLHWHTLNEKLFAYLRKGASSNWEALSRAHSHLVCAGSNFRWSLPAGERYWRYQRSVVNSSQPATGEQSEAPRSDCAADSYLQ